uniref:Uncharacterized protein n=3 Tax=environmental samples TaxID=68359 RepID=A0A075HP52_9EURY|nr:hypothetical protein [uncultured marine group II/III euryarchaeote KM3_15_B02]AIF14041.1 hypothetical protein [uncultured marine group II/III euryarchaeote KM3_65_G10]AIF17030.1 hypothetical protein [uncultured marine group II/III euryarchaeote KM3_75_F08]
MNSFRALNILPIMSVSLSSTAALVVTAEITTPALDRRNILCMLPRFAGLISFSFITSIIFLNLAELAPALSNPILSEEIVFTILIISSMSIIPFFTSVCLSLTSIALSMTCLTSAVCIGFCR